MRSWFWAIGLSVTLGAQAAPPQRVEIVYEVSRNGVAVAQVTQRFERDGSRYTLHETWQGNGLLALRGEAQRSSRGHVAIDGLQPEEFRDVRGGRERRRATFEGGGAPTLERQDRLSFIWTFALAPPSAPVTVRVGDGKGVVEYDYRPAGRESFDTAAGKFEALKLVRQKRRPDDRLDEIWLAVNRQHLPVRVRVTEHDGTLIDQIAVRIKTP